MFQVCALETTLDGRQVETPVLATPSEAVAMAVYRNLGEKLTGGPTPITLSIFDPRHPTGWRELLSMRKVRP